MLKAENPNIFFENKTKLNRVFQQILITSNMNYNIAIKLFSVLSGATNIVRWKRLTKDGIRIEDLKTKIYEYYSENRYKFINYEGLTFFIDSQFEKNERYKITKLIMGDRYLPLSCYIFDNINTDRYINEINSDYGNIIRVNCTSYNNNNKDTPTLESILDYDNNRIAKEFAYKELMENFSYDTHLSKIANEINSQLYKNDIKHHKTKKLIQVQMGKSYKMENIKSALTKMKDHDITKLNEDDFKHIKEQIIFIFENYLDVDYDGDREMFMDIYIEEEKKKRTMSNIIFSPLNRPLLAIVFDILFEFISLSEIENEVLNKKKKITDSESKYYKRVVNVNTRNKSFLSNVIDSIFRKMKYRYKSGLKCSTILSERMSELL